MYVENYIEEPACDCHLYTNRGCKWCGYSKEQKDMMLADEKITKANKYKRKDKKLFGANGVIKKRTIFD
jgi:hypothetical protein